MALPNTWQKRLGVCTYSYNIHWKAAREKTNGLPFSSTHEFIDYCHRLGAAGVQIGLGKQAPEIADEVRRKSETYGMYFEGQIGLPADANDIERFERDLRAAKSAGAEVVRTAALSGRRYETFDSAIAFEKFAAKAFQDLTRAEPILRRHKIKLAVENHKDWRVPEMLDLLRRLGSEYIGICVDTGNSIALLEDPWQVIEAYAPYAFSCHLKDMGVAESQDGFLLSEVPLGEGFLDVPRIASILLKANPKIWLNLEMITRDPLRIPCLTRGYWATMDSVPASDMAATLGMVRRHQSNLPSIAGLDLAAQLKLEADHVQRSFTAAEKMQGNAPSLPAP